MEITANLFNLWLLSMCACVSILQHAGKHRQCGIRGAGMHVEEEQSVTRVPVVNNLVHS